MNQIPTNIRVQFGNEMVLLKDIADVKFTKSGVKISAQQHAEKHIVIKAEAAASDTGRFSRIIPVITAVDWFNTEVQ